MNCIYQLLNCQTGERSPVMTEERKAFANRLKKFDIPSDHAVIVLMQQPSDNEDWVFSNAPLMAVETFMREFAENQTEGN